MPGAPGRRVALDVDDGSRRGSRTCCGSRSRRRKPPMTGALKLETKLEISARATKTWSRSCCSTASSRIEETRFTDPGMQKQDRRTQPARPRQVAVEAAAAQVTSDFAGSFKLANGVLTIPAVAFDVPGAVVRLAGAYSLESETIDFKGTLFMDAKISETVTGFKSVLLKVIDPLFKRGKRRQRDPDQDLGSAGKACVRPRQGTGLQKGRSSNRVIGNLASIHTRQSANQLLDYPIIQFPICYSSSASTRCACTMSSQGDHWKTVKCPSCEATSADASRWSWTNCAAERWRVPPSCEGWTIDAAHPFDRLGHHHLFHPALAAPAGDLGAERQQLVAIVHDRGAVDGGQPRDGVDRLRRAPPATRGAARLGSGSPHQIRELRERRRAPSTRIGLHDRLAASRPNRPARRAACRRGRARASTPRAARTR